MTESTPFKSGLVAIVGRPNVGKSTLMNQIVGQKVSITSHKPQTTRHRILGIHSTAGYQIVFVDTPGLHLNAKKAVNRYMNRAAASSLEDVDQVLFLVEAGRWTEEDGAVLDRLKGCGKPVTLVINKIDKLADKEALFPFLEVCAARGEFRDIVPVSAWKRSNLSRLEELMVSALPEGEAHFPDDMVTDRSVRFLCAEIIREKLMRTLGKELPYATSVEIESFKPRDDGLIEIHGLIWVERGSQKKIIIGKGGAQLREIGTQARIDIQHLVQQKVFLQLWVKVKEGWSDDDRALRSLGYTDD